MLEFILQKYRDFTETWKIERCKFMGETKIVSAVYEDDMDTFLSSIGILSDLENELLGCYYCGTTVTKQNFFACFPIHAVIAVCCNQPSCKIKLLEDNSF